MPDATSAPSWRPHRVAILGVGLLGGSIGLALRYRWPEVTVRGWGRRRDSLQAAESVGAITQSCDTLTDACEGSDCVIVCTPVSQIPGHVIQAARCAPQETLITDVGSTKASIVAAVEADREAAGRFVGSHPMAGSEKSGVEHADAHLLRGRRVIVTPTAATPTDRLHHAETLWRQLGAAVHRLDPATHDAIVATTSHLPHLVAAALVAVVDPDSLPFTGSGWRDTTRIAAGDPGLWTEIARDNAPAILASLEQFQQQLERLASYLREGQDAPLHRYLAAAKSVRDQPTDPPVL